MTTYIIKIMFTILLVFMGIVSSCNQSGSRTTLTNSKIDNRPDNPGIHLQLINDKIQSPVAMGVAGDGNNRLFICQKEGKVWIIKNGRIIAQPFLDVSNNMVSINSGYDERGLLGIAFNPNFTENHKFYVYYSAPSRQSGSDHKSILAEYRVSPGNADLADISTKRTLLEIEEPESNHNGGSLAFGPDGYLYVGVGDGGGGGDKHGNTGNGQNLQTLLGKILRIDVNGDPYVIPKDNPFINRKDVRPEIWAYGLRNPWRISFDRHSKQLFAGDVGQNKYEEIDIITKGGNYGWRIKEGFHDFKVHGESNKSNLLDPIYEYDHDDGISITGGYVYRGSAIPLLQGKYVYGDYNGKMWILTTSGNKFTNTDLEVINKPPGNMQILSYGEDEVGELYMLVNFSDQDGSRGAVFKLVK